MKIKLVIAAFAQLAIFHVAQSQCINRILPGCAPNILPMGETILPNPLLYPPNYIGPNIIDYPYEILPNGQLLPNVFPGPLPNILPGPILPNVFPGQIQPCISPCSGLPTVMQASVLPTTTIIQDSTVANNLANALQLLVVSNLLANTLPQNEVFVPNYPPVEMLPGPYGYNYMY